ncbi:MAG: hypothetical protein QG656_2678 [Candidatus Hydrogenedentes bacterium]|nr:hypothetical protein [Candidatus Hydrogenedentota bacterium]
MATIRKRTRGDGKVCFQVQVRKRGARPETATFDSLTKARQWVQQTESAIQEGRHFKGGESKKHSVSDAIDRYVRDVLPEKGESTVYGQTIQFEWWKTELGHLALSDLTPAAISEARDKLAATPTKRGKRTPATINRYLAALSACLKTAAQEWQWIPDNPMRQVRKGRESKGRVRCLSDDERARLLAACKEARTPYLYVIVVLALSTGARRSEITGLSWKQIDFERNLISLPVTKNGHGRGIPLAGLAKDLLLDMSKVRHINTNLVFPGTAAPGQKPKPFDFTTAWENAVEKAGIKDFRFHDCRHCAATYLAESGATLSELAATLGHRTLQMVARYQHLTSESVSPKVSAMNLRIFGTTDADTAQKGNGA